MKSKKTAEQTQGKKVLELLDQLKGPWKIPEFQRRFIARVYDNPLGISSIVRKNNGS